MQISITLTINSDQLQSITDTHLATLWHVAQANPAPHTDRDAGELVEAIGREIIRRFLAATHPELWHHQGRDYFWAALTDHCVFRDGKWVPKMTSVAATPESTMPRIGDDWPDQSGIYAGVMRGEDGAPDYHLIQLPGQVEQEWNAARAWAESVGGSLPTRREQRLLFANLPDEFDGEAYWSGEQQATYSYYAWHQLFDNGYQYYDLKSCKFRARPVRRLPIQPFGNSESPAVQTSAQPAEVSK